MIATKYNESILVYSGNAKRLANGDQSTLLK